LHSSKNSAFVDKSTQTIGLDKGLSGRKLVHFKSSGK
jgi:hypothetical protein